MKINNVDVALVKSVEDLAAGEEMKWTKTGVAVIEGQKIELFADGVKLTSGFGPDPDDIKEEPEVSLYNNYNGNIISCEFEIQHSGSSDITIHVWKDGGISFWISGGDNIDHSIPADYFLIGGFNGWTAEDADYKLTKVTGNQYQITGVELLAGDTLKVFWPDGETEPERYFSNASEGDGYTLDVDGNVVISTSGTYTINFYVESEYNNHVIPTRTGDLTSLQVSKTSSNLVVGGDADTVTASNVTDTLTAVSANTGIATVAVTGSTITITPVAAGSTTITVSDGSEVTRTINVTVNEQKTISISLGVWANDSAVVFAWVWGDEVDGYWVKVTGSSITVVDGVDHIILVRMPSGSESGAWSGYWNRTAEGGMEIQEGKVLTFSAWDVGGYSTFTWETPAP